MDWKGNSCMLKEFKYKELMKPLGILLGCSFVYNLGFLLLSTFIMNYVVQTTLSLLSAIVLYCISSKLWNKDAPIVFKQLFQVLIIEMIWLLFVFVISDGLNQIGASVLSQIINAILVLFALPFELLYFYQLHLQKTNIKEIFQGIFVCIKKNGRTIFNTYCFILILIVVLDTLTGGLFSISSGIDTQQMFMTIVLFANPLMNCMMQMFVIAGMGLSMMDAIVPMFLFLIIGVWMGLIELNYILYIKRKCEE